MVTPYQYGWLHVPSGKRGYSEVIVEGGNHIDLLIGWNMMGVGVWIYFPVNYLSDRCIDKRQCFLYNRGQYILQTCDKGFHYEV